MQTQDKQDEQKLGQQVIAYCNQFDIPVEHFMEILRDQKVVPMLRGKGMEYNALHLLQAVLKPGDWDVRKLNLNPQPGTLDQDIEITHRRTNERFVVETKSAVRGSMREGKRSRVHKMPHFQVKCHRSRSNMKAEKNDRYRADSFDVLLTNPVNALFQGGTVGETLEVTDDIGLLEVLYTAYGVSSSETLIRAATQDWRFVFPEEIAVDGYIPRTPVVYLTDDLHWQTMGHLEARLAAAVRQRLEQRRKTRS